jgi:hypothetical protein
MRKLAPLLLACVISTGAYAQESSITKEISGYRGINVSFSENAQKCNLKDAKLFEDHLRTKLAGIGVTQREDLYSYVDLLISGQKFGIIGGHCVTEVRMNFYAVLTPANIVTSDERLKSTLDKLERIPVTYYQDGRLGVQPQDQPSGGGESTTSQEAVLKMIENLVESLKSKRQ